MSAVRRLASSVARAIARLRRPAPLALPAPEPPAPDSIARLGDDVLLVVARLEGDLGAVRGALADRGGGRAVQCRAVPLDENASPDTPPRPGRAAIVLRLDSPADELEIAVEIDAGRGRLTLDPGLVAGAARGLEGLEASFAALAPGLKRRLWEAAWEVCAPALEGSGGYELAQSLHRLREALRTRLPVRTHTGDERLTLNLDRILALDSRAFWIKGWIRDRDGIAAELVAVSPEGCRIELAGVFRHRRPDVEEAFADAHADADPNHGFIVYLELPVPSLLTDGWLLELHATDGGGVESPVPPVGRDLAFTRRTIFNDTLEDAPHRFDLTREHTQRALTRLQEAQRAVVAVDDVVQHGAPVQAPEVTVIVPLYQRIDFVEHQIAQFVRDPRLRRADVLYVLDSPELREPLHRLAASLHEFYGFPFRVAALNRNGGYSTVNNLGAGLARGRLLLLLNSDVFPDRPGWLQTLCRFYDATPAIGALGPKLLYEDDSIQHAGMLFERDAASGVWGNQHYFKGLSRSFPPANVARPVPAVTGACLMIDRALYEEVGGLRDVYVQGGYEDSDLCLRLLDAGRRNWYLPAAELYHLEDQSYSHNDYRMLVTRYNRWLQTHLWGVERIERVMLDARAEGQQGVRADPRLVQSATRS